MEFGLSEDGIDKRLQRGRLYRVHAGVYSLRPRHIRDHQRWLAAVLACGPGALLDGISSAELRASPTRPPSSAMSQPRVAPVAVAKASSSIGA